MWPDEAVVANVSDKMQKVLTEKQYRKRETGYENTGEEKSSYSVDACLL